MENLEREANFCLKKNKTKQNKKKTPQQKQ